MNEFIVWDKEKHIFVPQGEIIFSFYGDNKIVVTPNCIEYIGDTCHDNYNENRFNIFNHIGLKDINGKSIYADSSIVEFDKYSCGHSEQLKGFIRESSPMIFQIVILDNDIWNILYWHEFRHSIKNFKIIDTIQENKLGLIKEG